MNILVIYDELWKFYIWKGTHRVKKGKRSDAAAAPATVNGMKSNFVIGRPRRLESKSSHKPGDLPFYDVSAFGGRV